jgi:hypothetical protein
VRITVPFLTNEQLGAAAEQFLDEHHPSRSIPVPIEEIIEFDFGMDIIAMPGFHLNYEVDAFISTCLSEIRIDKAVAEAKNKNRYRFSLAHELSHRLLHSDVFSQLKFATIAEWKASRDLIPPREYNRLESQANRLAGLILVPKVELAQRFNAAMLEVERAGVAIQSATEEDWEMIERFLAAEFGVSPYVIRIRGEKDGLWRV